MRKRQLKSPVFQGRRFFLMLGLIGVLGVLLLRSIWLEVFYQDFLQKKADERQLRDVIVPAYRGMILDRNDEPMAVSSPVVSLSCDPQAFLQMRETWRHAQEISGQIPPATTPETTDKKIEKTAAVDPERFAKLEAALRQIEQITELSEGELLSRLEDSRSKSFLYLGRQLPPEAADAVLTLFTTKEARAVKLESTQGYRRFYPLGETAGHVLGLTNTEGAGIEGMERTQNEALAGVDGKKRVIRDAKGHWVENVESLKDMQSGRDIQLSLDRRIQYVAYQALKTKVFDLQAKAGSVVVLDAHSGEILAMANVPSFNPNNRKELEPYLYRNRAAMDKSEPGSTLKPLTIAAALESRAIGPDVEINTSPGKLSFGKYTVKDPKDYGSINLATLLAKSSNVGVSRVALFMNPRDHWMFLNRVGFGRVPDSGLSAETAGQLTNYTEWSKVDRASHGYGYGLSTSLLQLTHAYAPFAANGVLMPVSIFMQDKTQHGQQVMTPETARSVLRMMEAVVQTGGTGEKAMVEGYRVAGKTGTAYKFVNGAYRNDRYLTSFIGIAPASRPRLVVAVQIDEPKVDDSGGRAAAPVFSKVMGEALRLLDIPPDNLPRAKKINEKQPIIGNPP